MKFSPPSFFHYVLKCRMLRKWEKTVPRATASKHGIHYHQCPLVSFFPSRFMTTGSKILNLIKLKLCTKYLLAIAFNLFILKDEFPHIAAKAKAKSKARNMLGFISMRTFAHVSSPPWGRTCNSHWKSAEFLLCDLMSVKLTTMWQGTSGVEWRNSAFLTLKESH